MVYNIFGSEKGKKHGHLYFSHLSTTSDLQNLQNNDMDISSLLFLEDPLDR